MTVPATQPHEDDILGKAYDRKLMRRLLVYTRPYRPLMYGAFALLCVGPWNREYRCEEEECAHHGLSLMTPFTSR